MIHPWIGALAFGGGVTLVLIALRQPGRDPSALLRAHEQASGAMYSLQMNDAAQGEIARALGMQEALVRRQLQARETLSAGACTSPRRSTAVFSAVTKFSACCCNRLSLGLGAYLALQQEISAGGIIAASILIARAFAPLELIVGAWRQFEQGSQAYKVLNDVLATQECRREIHFAARPARRRLSAENVAVRAPSGDRLLLAAPVSGLSRARSSA